MARKFLTHLDLAGNQLINASLEKLSSAPNTGNFEGRMYYNTSDDRIYVYDGSAWKSVGAVTDIQGTTNEVDVSASTGSVTISLPSTINASTTGNAATATALQTARTISLGGDLSGSASFDGTSDITITALVDSNASVDSITGTANEIDVSASVGAITLSLPSTINADTTGNAATASSLQTSRTIALGGDLSGSASFDGSASVTITAQIAANSVALGTDTTGNYVADITAGTGISVSGGNAENANITVSNTGVTGIAGTENQISVSASTGSVTLSLPSAVTFPGTVTLNADPTQALQAATKQYVDAVSEGLHIHASVEAATTASVDLSSPPAAIDGVTLTDGMRVLVKNQPTTSQNGIYVYDLANTDLVRASDFNSAAEIAGGDFVFVTGGSTYDNTGWVQTEAVATVGTDAILWTQFSGAGTYLAGNGLTLTGNLFSIDTSITVDKTTAQTLSNKTLTSPIVSGLYLSDNNIVIEGTNDIHETTLNFTDPTQDNTITFKNATGTVAFTSDIPSTTDGLTEGSTNLYFTNERAEDAVGAILTDTATVDLTYTDNGASAGTISADVILKSTNSYLTSASGLAIDISALETKLVTDSFTRKASANVGNGSNTSFAVSHNLGTRDVVVNIYDNATYESAEADVVRTDTNTVTVSFGSAPANNAYRVVVVG